MQDHNPEMSFHWCCCSTFRCSQALLVFAALWLVLIPPSRVEGRLMWVLNIQPKQQQWWMCWEMPAMSICSPGIHCILPAPANPQASASWGVINSWEDLVP